MLKDDFSADATVAYWSAQHNRHTNAKLQKRQARSDRRAVAQLYRAAAQGVGWPRLLAGPMWLALRHRRRPARLMPHARNLLTSH
jgi:hypothetical protein